MDELTKKRKENAIDEISEILLEMNKCTDKLCDWVKCHNNDDFLKSDGGQKLKKDILDMCTSHAYSFLDISIIHMEDLGLL